MPLILPMLTQGLAAALSSPTPSFDAAAERLAGAYARYAAAGTAAGIPWVPTGAEELRLRMRLRAGMVKDGGSPLAFATAFSEGLLAFWMTPPVPFGPGVTAAMLGLPGLQVTLAAFFANPNNPTPAVVSTLAGALDLATRTVVVVYPVTGPVPLI